MLAHISGSCGLSPIEIWVMSHRSHKSCPTLEMWHLTNITCSCSVMLAYISGSCGLSPIDNMSHVPQITWVMSHTWNVAFNKYNFGDALQCWPISLDPVGYLPFMNESCPTHEMQPFPHRTWLHSVMLAHISGCCESCPTDNMSHVPHMKCGI